jgi:hypothetical protein
VQNYDKQCQQLAQQQPGHIHPSMTVRSPAGQAAADSFRSEVLVPHMMHAILETRPFHAYINSLQEQPMLYRVHVPRNLKTMLAHGREVKRNPSKAADASFAAAASSSDLSSSAGAKRRRNNVSQDRDDSSDAGDDNDGIVDGAEVVAGTASADGDMSAFEWLEKFGGGEGSHAGDGRRVGRSTDSHTDRRGDISALFKEVDTAMLSGGYVSREAKERNLFKRNMQQRFEKQRGGRWQQQRSAETASASSASSSVAAVASGGEGGWRGGARGVRHRGGESHGGDRGQK